MTDHVADEPPDASPHLSSDLASISGASDDANGHAIGSSEFDAVAQSYAGIAEQFQDIRRHPAIDGANRLRREMRREMREVRRDIRELRREMRNGFREVTGILRVLQYG